MANPTVPLTDPKFNWEASYSTDVRATWKRFGWTPPSEQKQGFDPMAALSELTVKKEK